MKENILWQIPPATLQLLKEIPTDKPVVMLLRHSVRPPLPPEGENFSVPLTEEGVRLARELGQRLCGRLRSLRTSPFVRCMETARALLDGAGADLPIAPDKLLGEPGIFIVDRQVALQHWQERGHKGMMAHLAQEDKPLPGMAAPEAAARFLVHHMLSASGTEPGCHVFVTHNSIITVAVARLLGKPLGADAWPWFLEAAFFWRVGETLHIAYRDHRTGRRGPLCGFDELDVVEFARREVAATVGPVLSARFFLAGGAFKTLLTGKPPRDLDLWAPSEPDREVLISSLLARGAKRLGERPFADAFEIGGRVVEILHKTEPATLEERLGRFDLGLSAVGVEHLPGGQWRAVIHPLARESVQRRQVLLLKPLVSWKYALATLERMYRYGRELGYAVPEEEVAEIWRVFDSQPREMQQGMIERFDRTALGGDGVHEEALRRLR